MRIAQISPLRERVPPPRYGGTEAVVSLLTEGLVRLGHEVVLFASGDSQTAARLSSVYPRSLRTAVEVKDFHPYEWHHVAEALERAGDFDILHNHAGELPMAFGGLVDTPMLSTMHCLPTNDTSIVWKRYRGFYNTISHAQRHAVPVGAGGTFLGVVYNAIDVSSYPYQARKDDYLLFLSRIASEKGTHLAIQVAQRLGITLLIAGKVDEVDVPYYEKEVKPHLDGHRIRFLGEADGRMKRQLYARARCLLLPLCWEEPFGLVMAEAMACGTPVIAFRRGAAVELIRHGQTGFLVRTVGEMAQAVTWLGRIDPAHCRRHVTENFDTERMVQGYLQLYRRILELQGPSKLPSPPTRDLGAVA